MISSDQPSGFIRKSAWLQEGIFFLTCCLYLLYRVHPVLSLEVQTPVFFKTIGFWQEYLKFPGGLTDWFSQLLMQFWTTDLWSSLFLAAGLWLVAFFTRKWLSILSQKPFVHTFHLIPAALLLLLHVQYSFRPAITIALILNLAAVVMFMIWKPRQQALRYTVIAATSVLLYWISGGTFLIFTFLLGLDELLSKKRYVPGVMLLLTGAVLPVLVADFLVPISRQQAFLHNLSLELPAQPAWAAYGLYAFYLLAGIIVLMNKSGWISAIAGKTGTLFKLTPLRKWVTGSVLVLAVTGLLAEQSYNNLVRLVLQVNRSARESNWDKVLSAVQSSGITNPLLAANTNLALFQKGVLLDKMFAYPQNEGPGGLLMSRTWCLSWPEEVSNLCWKLGLVNGALHWGHEALETKGASADILTRLAMVYMLKGMNEAAEHFLLNLKNIPFHFNAAEDMLQLNNHPSEFRQTMVYKYIQSYMPDVNIVSLGRPSLYDLDMLMNKNPANKMALEYRMAYYLLEGRPQEILKHISDFGGETEKQTGRLVYSPLPRYVQEGLIVAASSNPQLDQEQLKKWIEQSTIVRYSQYRQILAKYKNDKAVAKPYLQSQFGDTYWYYLMFVKPPAQQMEGMNEFQ